MGTPVPAEAIEEICPDLKDCASGAQNSVSKGQWQVDTLCSLAEIKAHRSQWSALECDTLDPHAAFQSYCWCESWAQTYCKNDQEYPKPRIFLIYKSNELVGILPMMLIEHRGMIGLSLFGHPHSQLANMLVKANVDIEDGLRLCLENARRIANVDVMSLSPIPEGSALLGVLNSDKIDCDPAECMSLIDWPKVWRSEDYVSSLTKNRRKDFNHKNNRLRRMGEVRYEHLSVRDANFQSLVKTAIQWKKDWLVETGKYSVGLSHPNFDEFLTNFSANDGGFEPEIDVLSINYKPIAISVNLMGRGFINCYLTSYDPDYAQTAAGMLLYQYAVRNCIDDGLLGYNFLGYPTDFKTMWSTDFVPLYRYQDAITLRGALWVSVWSRRLRPMAKRVFQKISRFRNAPVIGSIFSNLLSKVWAK